MCTADYYYYPINIPLLRSSGFITGDSLPERSIQEESSSSFKRLTPRLFDSSLKLLNTHLEKFKLRQVYTLEDFIHYFYEQHSYHSYHSYYSYHSRGMYSFHESILKSDETSIINYLSHTPIVSPVQTWVNESEEIVADLFSYYVIRALAKNKQLIRIAYIYYTANETLSVKDLILCAIDNITKNNVADVIAILDVGDKREDTFSILQGFFKGAPEASLKYHFYNWKCGKLNTSDVNLLFF